MLRSNTIIKKLRHWPGISSMAKIHVTGKCHKNDTKDILY